MGKNHCKPKSKRMPRDPFWLAVGPDWTARGTAMALQKEYTAFVFCGPGLYLNDNETALVLHESISRGKEWKKDTKTSDIFVMYYWNHNIRNTLFSVAASIPIRVDLREV